jgi:hypothetical protein
MGVALFVWPMGLTFQNIRIYIGETKGCHFSLSTHWSDIFCQKPMGLTFHKIRIDDCANPLSLTFFTEGP